MNQLSDPIFWTESAFMPEQPNSWYLQLFIDHLYPIFAYIQPISSQSATIGAIHYNLWVRLRPRTWTTGYLREKFQKGLHVSLLQWIPNLRNVNLFYPTKNHQKPSQKPTERGNIQIPQCIFVSFSLNPRRCAKSLTFPASTASLRQSFTTRCCERRRRWKSRTSSCRMWSCLWSLELWTGKRSAILNSVCHV